MKIFKFGGASVKDAASVRNLDNILRNYPDDDLIVVISAMGKTTNALEEVVRAYYHKTGDPIALLRRSREFHQAIINELFPGSGHVGDRVNNLFVEIEWVLEDEPNGTYDFIYDQVVSQGEMLSTVIVSAWLEEQGFPVKWIDVRDLIRTDNTYREAKVDWETSGKLLEAALQKKEGKIFITQGFLGGTSENYTTTLGREGSDYTAAILAYLAGAESVTIWKDVPGVLNADPKWFNDCVLIERMTYQDALELAFYGASVIHPKTIKPLQNKDIPLYVRSFLKPDTECTIISNETTQLSVPGYIVKDNQLLISISPRDFSFIMEENLTRIFDLFSRRRVHINIMQNSALSFTVCVDDDHQKTPGLLEELASEYTVRYNHPLQLITIRNADQQTTDMLMQNREVLLDVRSRNTVQLVVRGTGSGERGAGVGGR